VIAKTSDLMYMLIVTLLQLICDAAHRASLSAAEQLVVT